MFYLRSLNFLHFKALLFTTWIEYLRAPEIIAHVIVIFYVAPELSHDNKMLLYILILIFLLYSGCQCSKSCDNLIFKKIMAGR